MAAPFDPTAIGNLPFLPAAPDPYAGNLGQVVAIEEAISEGLDPEAGAATEEMLPKPLSLQQKKAILSQEIRDASSYYGGELSESRKAANDAYHGRPYGNERDGFSKVVTQDVLKTVRWAMPPIMKILTGGEFMGRYMARYKRSVPFELAEARSDQATEYVNQQLETGGGFMHVHTLVQDALLEKTGIGHVDLEERISRQKETHRGLSDPELFSLLSDPQTTPYEYEAYVEQTPMGPVKLHNVTIVREDREPRLRFENIPNEHFLISRRTPGLTDETPFVGHRYKVTKSDLIASGYDPRLVLALPTHDVADYDDEHLNRFLDEETSARLVGMRHDIASQEVWVTDCSVLIDADGDGFSERKRFILAGSDSSIVILDERDEAQHGYYAICPLPLSHKFYGLSLADLVMDLQLIRSTVLRSILDFMYQSISPPTEALEGEVNLDDLMHRRTGSVVRVRSIGAFVEHPPIPPPSGIFDLYNELRDEAEQRSGVTRSMHHLDMASGKNQTLGGVQELLMEGAVCIDLMTRIFAETGIKSMFKKALGLLHCYPQMESILRVRGEYVPVDPSLWDPMMDVSIDVALGAGQSGKRLETLAKQLEIQMGLTEAGLGGRVVSERNVYATCMEISREAGFRNPSKFWTDPAMVPPPEPEPNPKLMQELSQARKREQDAARDRRKLDLAEVETLSDVRTELMQAIAALRSAEAQMIAARKPTGGGGD